MLTRSSIALCLTALLLAILACGPTTAPEATAPPSTEAPVQPAEPTETQAPQAQEFFTEEFDGDLSNWTQKILKNADEGDTDLATDQRAGWPPDL